MWFSTGADVGRHECRTGSIYLYFFQSFFFY